MIAAGKATRSGCNAASVFGAASENTSTTSVRISVPRATAGCLDQIIAKQDQSDQTIGALQKLLGEFGTAITFAGFMAQLVAVQAHEGCFRARKKRGKHQQYSEQPKQGR